MGQYDFLYTQMAQKETDYSVYSCPLCGADNAINSTECRRCKYDLIAHEALLFLRWNKYTEALACVKSEQYISALENITQFLEYYQKDRDALRLRLYILYKLQDKDFERKVEEHIRQESDRWADKLLDTPDQVTLDDFNAKEAFNGKQTKHPLAVIGARQKENFNNAQALIETINALYQMRHSGQRKASKQQEKREFDFFYDSIFLVYLARREISVVDFLGGNFSKLPNEHKKMFGGIEEIKDRRQPDDLIVKVFQPEIHYHALILQKAKIAVINNRPTRTEEGKLNGN